MAISRNTTRLFLIVVSAGLLMLMPALGTEFARANEVRTAYTADMFPVAIIEPTELIPHGQSGRVTAEGTLGYIIQSSSPLVRGTTIGELRANFDESGSGTLQGRWWTCEGLFNFCSLGDEDVIWEGTFAGYQLDTPLPDGTIQREITGTSVGHGVGDNAGLKAVASVQGTGIVGTIWPIHFDGYIVDPR